VLPPLLAGIALFVAVVLLSRWFATATPGAVLRSARWAGLAALAAGVAFLAVTGRLAWAFAALMGLVPWILRAMRVHAAYRGLRGVFGRMRTGGAAGDVSRVETGFLRMELDHDTGALSGEVVAGAFKGARLSDLSPDQAKALWREVASDPQSVQVLEAWLDRSHPDWRDTFGASGRADTRRQGAMTREEAFEVLGLSPGAGAKEIKEAHRRLMKHMHPDHGGSTYLAARINQARDLLLNT
jgi:hypothetical protein